MAQENEETIAEQQMLERVPDSGKIDTTDVGNDAGDGCTIKYPY